MLPVRGPLKNELSHEKFNFKNKTKLRSVKQIMHDVIDCSVAQIFRSENRKQVSGVQNIL